VPTVETRTLLERGIALADELGLTDAQPAQSPAHRRPRTLADANRSNVGRLDQRYRYTCVNAGIVLGGNRSGREPSGGAAANDDDFSYAIAHADSVTALYAFTLAKKAACKGGFSWCRGERHSRSGLS
jgi:hypothetical protein